MDDREPIGDDEFLLRRFRESDVDYSLEIPVTPAGFRPSSEDEDGLSIFRRLFVEPSTVALHYKNPPVIYVSELKSFNIRELSLTVVPSPIESLPGHAIIPELNITDYKKKDLKRALKEKCYALAEIASKSIVHTPSDLLSSE